MSGIKLFSNVPEKFLPPQEDWPDFIYAHPDVNWVHYREHVNVASEILDGIAKHGWGNDICIYDANKNKAWTYNRLQEEVNRLGNALKKLGIKPGDQVMWRFGEEPEAAVVALAIWKIGAINVATALQERAREIEFIANDTEAVMIICQADQEDPVQKALPNLKTVKHIISVPESRHDNMLDYRKLLSEAETELEAYPNLPGDAANIFYTGGTTGHPKGCLHTHATQLIICDMNCKVVYDITPQDVIFCAAPLGHGFGNHQKINFPFRFGASAVYKERPTPKEIWELLIKYKVSVFVGIPTLYRMMLDCFDPSFRDKLNLRLCSCAGEMLHKDLMDRWNEQVGVELSNSVGLVPMGNSFIQSVVNGCKVAPGLSVGKPIPGYEYKLIDDNGNTVKNGEIGRLAVRGVTGIVYWNNLHPYMPGKQKEDVRNGWCWLDDAYTQDEDGWLFFHTRLDNMIVTGGRQVAAPEVEEVLTGHPAVNQVAVVGVPDPVRTQSIKAFIVLNPSYAPSDELVKEIQQYAKENMSVYKYPRIIEFIDDLPRDHVGKIQRRILREKSIS